MVATLVDTSQGKLAAQQAEAAASLQQLCAATAGAQAATAAGLEAQVAQQQQPAAETAEQAASLKSQVDALAAGLAAQQGSTQSALQQLEGLQAALQQLEGSQADKLQGQAGLPESMPGTLKQLDALQIQVRTSRSVCSQAHTCEKAYAMVSAQSRIHSRTPCRAPSSSLIGCNLRPDVGTVQCLDAICTRNVKQ